MTNFKKKSGKLPNMLYGFHAVSEAWLNEGREIKALYVTDAALKGFEKTLLEAKGKGLARPQYQRIDKQALEKMLPQGAVHQGLALDTPLLDERDVQDLIIRSKSEDSSILIMLDQVTDPHNVGAILRSATALGATGMILQKKHAPNFSGVLAKTACGALEHLPIAQETNLSRTLDILKDEGFFAIGLDERGAQTIAEFQDGVKDKSHQKIVLVLGAEGPGLRPLVRDNCDALVKLPTQGAIQSLNVSNAAAVALYALL